MHPKISSKINAADNSQIHIGTNQTAAVIINNERPHEAPDLADIKNKLSASYQQPEFTKISLPFSNQSPKYLESSYIDIDVVEYEFLSRMNNTLNNRDEINKKEKTLIY